MNSLVSLILTLFLLLTSYRHGEGGTLETKNYIPVEVVKTFIADNT